MTMTKHDANTRQTMLTDALIAEAEYMAQLPYYTTAAEWQNHIGMMANNARRLAEVETVLRQALSTGGLIKTSDGPPTQERPFVVGSNKDTMA